MGVTMDLDSKGRGMKLAKLIQGGVVQYSDASIQDNSYGLPSDTDSLLILTPFWISFTEFL